MQSRRHGRRCSGLGSFDFFSMLLLTKRHDHSAFSISCCLRKKFTQVALVWRCVSYLRDRRAQYGSVQQGSAKSCLCTKNHAGKLHTPAQVKNHGQQHEEGKIWDTVKKNSKEPKMSSSPSSFSRIPVHCPQSSCAMSKLFSRIPVHSKQQQQQQGILVNKERANNLEPLALLIERGHAHGHRVQPKRS